jgi:DNA-binding FrmR family transcriptional regulator
MAHTTHDKKKLLNRIRRIRGQIDGIERLIDQDQDENCFILLQTIAACRGAINGLMSEIIEEHVRLHMFAADGHPTAEQVQAAKELNEIVKTYLK